jgi:peptidoglycan hydrolase-like protein with peptidoglycan-binding domain
MVPQAVKPDQVGIIEFLPVSLAVTVGILISIVVFIVTRNYYIASDRQQFRSARQFGISKACSLLLALLLSACSQLPKVAPTPVPPLTPVSTSVAAPRPAPNVVTEPRAVAATQRALVLLGYDTGKPDGANGPATRRAILSFQRDHALAEDGLITVALLDTLNTLVAQLQKKGPVVVAAGDLIIFEDGSTEIVKRERAFQREQDSGRGVVAIRPSTVGWPPAARAGLDWAIVHALDVDSLEPVQWSSTGVDQRFEINATTVLSPRESQLVGANAHACRHFELRTAQRQRRYSGVACLDAKGDWSIPRSKIRLDRPATGLGSTVVDKERTSIR